METVVTDGKCLFQRFCPFVSKCIWEENGVYSVISK
jgi:hypothetical protein